MTIAVGLPPRRPRPRRRIVQDAGWHWLRGVPGWIVDVIDDVREIRRASSSQGAGAAGPRWWRFRRESGRWPRTGITQYRAAAIRRDIQRPWSQLRRLYVLPAGPRRAGARGDRTRPYVRAQLGTPSMLGPGPTACRPGRGGGRGQADGQPRQTRDWRG